MEDSTTTPLVSVIVPTYHSAATLDACLKSLHNQTYDHIEIVVVDNNSADTTKDIAAKYTDKVFDKGPERSWQRNYGVEKASGEYVAIIDSDMELTPGVIEACVLKVSTSQNISGVIIPEESFGEGLWAQCKKLERSFYVGVDAIEAARFFPKKVYELLNGYDTELISGEDWDLSQRAAETGELVRVDDFIMHNEGKLSLKRTLKKKYYYAQQLGKYSAKHGGSSAVAPGQGPIDRYKLFFSQPKKLFRNPFLGFAMLFMKTAEYAYGLGGVLVMKVNPADGR